MGMTVNSMAGNELQKNFIRFNATNNSTGVKSAADDPAGYAISEKITAQEKGLNQGSDNTADMNNALMTAESGLSSINDSLQRIQELTLQANSGIMTSGDKAIIQEEVNQILDSIKGTVNSTEFNNQKLLDGTFSDRNTASGADGKGAQVSINDMSLEALELEDFNVSDPTALDTIMSAIDTVSAQRSGIGAMSNTFAHTINSNDVMSLNLASARSGIMDTDMTKMITESNKEQALQEYRMAMQTSEINQNQRVMNTLMQ